MGTMHEHQSQNTYNFQHIDVHGYYSNILLQLLLCGQQHSAYQLTCTRPYVVLILWAFHTIQWNHRGDPKLFACSCRTFRTTPEATDKILQVGTIFL